MAKIISHKVLRSSQAYQLRFQETQEMNWVLDQHEAIFDGMRWNVHGQSLSGIKRLMGEW